MKMEYETLHHLFMEKLLKEGFDSETANLLATIFADNTRDGIASHGINRFPRFITQIREHTIRIDTRLERTATFGAWEQWDGHHGPGPLNATKSMARAIDLAHEHGIGMVALRNTTHWMRGATYGYQAAEARCAAICWTNTTANMSPWGTHTHAIGNNPMVMAVPARPEPIVLDMAMSQYSYGKMELLRETGEQLPYPGGFDTNGLPSTDPVEILSSRQVLPIGMWKGSGLSIMLDLFASMLSGGSGTVDIPIAEPNCSQMFIAISPKDETQEQAWINSIRHTIGQITELCGSHGESVRFPGDRSVLQRRQSLEHGIDVAESMLDKVNKL